MNTCDLALLESALTRAFLEKYPDIWFHTTVVHANRWVAVYVFVPADVSEDEFGEVVVFTDCVTRAYWPEPLCKHKTSVALRSVSMSGRATHYYSFWLPIPPARRSVDFEKSFSGGSV